MLITTKPYLTNNLPHFHWGPSETLQRDKEQSPLLHEPKFRIMTTDPISGLDVDDYMSHCSLLDGNLTVYFETEANCNEYRTCRLIIQTSTCHTRQLMMMTVAAEMLNVTTKSHYLYDLQRTN